MSKIIALSLFIIFAVSHNAAAAEPQKKAEKEPQKEKVSYDGMRNLWFKAIYEDLSKKPVYIGDAKAYIAAMEFMIDKSKVIVLASSEGDASLYFESKNENGVGGFIGGSQYPDIAAAAKKMVTVASGKAKQMDKDEALGFVQGDDVKFMMATKSGKYSAEFPRDKVESASGHPFQDMYTAGQAIITLYRQRMGHGNV